MLFQFSNLSDNCWYIPTGFSCASNVASYPG